MSPPAKSPRQDAKVIEAWAVFFSYGDMDVYRTKAGADYYNSLAGLSGGRVVRLTSAPPTAADGRVEELEREVKRLREAIRWALGEIGHFPPRQEGQGAYWWRTELLRRAALTPAKKGRVKP